MNRKFLKNKPLVEAILEVRWSLQRMELGQETDPHHKLLLGRLFDRLQEDYPEYEQLPTANIPDGLVGHVVQHRFRTGNNQWPLVQLGPGILTVNSTADYTWEDFQPRAIVVIEKLLEAYPRPAELHVTHLLLRYIDAVPFDQQSENAFSFLRDKMKIGIDLPSSLFHETNVNDRPITLSWQSAFKCEEPKGIVSIQIGMGQKDDQTAIIWDTSVQSAGDDVPSLPQGFSPWVDAAHAVTGDWFFKLIEGELERSFSGE